MERKNKNYQKEYSKKEKDKKNENAKKYYLENKEKIKKRVNQYYLENKEVLDNGQKKYRQENVEKIIEYRKKLSTEKKKEYSLKANYKNKNRAKNEPLFRLTKNIRTLVGKSIRENGFKKESKTFNILGCSFEDFKIHLESKFESWMNWVNYGNPKDGIFETNKTWDIDHIKPLATATTEEELLKLNHYTNLQPLCSYQNRYIKRDNY